MCCVCVWCVREKGERWSLPFTRDQSTKPNQTKPRQQETHSLARTVPPAHSFVQEPPEPQPQGQPLGQRQPETRGGDGEERRVTQEAHTVTQSHNHTISRAHTRNHERTMNQSRAVTKSLGLTLRTELPLHSSDRRLFLPSFLSSFLSSFLPSFRFLAI